VGRSAERRARLVVATLALLSSLVPTSEGRAQERIESRRSTQWNLLAFGGGDLAASVSDAGAGASWSAGLGTEFITHTNLGGRLLAATWLPEPLDVVWIDAGIVWQWDRSESRAWYLSAGPSAVIDFSDWEYDDTDVYWGLSAAVGLSGTPDGFGLAPEIRLGYYSDGILTLGARLYVHFGPL
jgi:hypothetical protein